MSEKIEKTPSERLMELMHQYTSIKDIPDAELLAIGYFRTEDGQISSVKSEQETSPYKQAMEKKRQNAPFDEIAITLQKKEIMTRRLNASEIRRLRQTTNTDDLKVEMKTFFQNEDAGYFKETFINFLKKIKFDQFDIKKLSESCEFMMGITLMLWEDTIERQIEIMTDESISTEESSRLLSLLNKKKGIFLDKDYWRGRFFENIDEDAEGNTRLGYPIIVLSDFAQTYFKEKNLHTFEQAMLHLCREFLLSQGFIDVAAIIESCRTLVEMREKIKTTQKRDLPSGKLEIELRKTMRDQTPEEKRTQSSRLKTIEEAVRKERKIVSGMGDFFLPDTLIVDFYRSRIKKIEKMLIASTTEKSSVDFFLDGRPNDKLDRDPGEMSGDCTAGKPLPFKDPDIPVYNIKVYNAAHEHIGNIYLLVAQDIENHIYWHLEAIQIPEGIDWDASAEIFIDRIVEEAQKKNVQGITVNMGEAQISNYDFIEQSIRRFHKKRNLGKKEIIIPMRKTTDTKYSDFQGNGEVLVLWEKETDNQI